MEKREQVFVSSTYEDLKEARDTVIFGLLEANCFPAGMELFPASNASQWDLIKSIIDDSDYYLLILAGRYGSTDPTDGISYTEKEFDYAVETGKPVVVFAYQDPATLPANATDQNDIKRGKLEAFRAKACSGRTVKFWTQKEQLPGMAAMALNNLRKFNSAVGWVRGDKAMTSEVQKELAELRTALAEANKHMLNNEPMFSDLANGEDAISFDVDFWVDTRDGYTRKTSREQSLTWNEIFQTVGPLLLHEATEAQLENALNVEVIRRLGNLAPESIEIPQRVYNQVVIQLMANTLIERAPGQVDGNGRRRSWKLTSRGEDFLMGTAAIRVPGATKIS